MITVWGFLTTLRPPALQEAKQKAGPLSEVKGIPAVEMLGNTTVRSSSHATTKHDKADRRPRTREERMQREALREQEHAKMLAEKKWR
jgi:hypothetical protein